MIDIVVARYKENIDWLNRFNLSGNDRLFIYNKSKDHFDVKIPFKCEYLQNIGREAHTFLYHIVKYYDDLADETLFLQGHPFDHEPSFERLQGFVDGKADYNTYKTYDIVSLRGHHYDNGHHYHELFDIVYDKTIPYPTRYRFSSGAQYIVKKEGIIKHDKEVWQKLLEKSINHHQLPWNIERVWMYIFSDVFPNN